ncbi:MAG: glycosyltransferase family 1 protein [Algoriphagus sp.]|nr:glycosyltransferase family 1 protein [Algoriphagus sp.]
MKRICVDVTNISPGKGGAGGGITTYAKNLLLGLDYLVENSDYSDLEIVAIGHSEFLEGLKLQRIKTVHRKVNNQSFVKRNFWLHISLPLFLKKNHFQILHRVIPELPVFKTARYVMTLHDFMFDFYLENPVLKKYLGLTNQLKFLFLRSLMRKSVDNHDCILVPSFSIKDEFKKRCTNKKLHIEVTKLATNDRLISRKRNGTNSSDISFGYVAGFYPHKGHKYAINLMKMFQQTERGKNVKLFFRGSKVYRDYYLEIEALIRKEGLENKVFIEGFDPNISLKEIYDKYTTTLLLSEYEGFGLPVLESQSFGKPVICSDIPVFRENLKDSAIFLNNNPSNQDIEELLDKLFDREFLDELAEKGIENSAQYSWAKTTKRTFESYLKLL